MSFHYRIFIYIFHNYWYFLSITGISSSFSLPYTSPLTVKAGDKPQAPLHLVASNVYNPSAEVSPTSKFNSRLSLSTMFWDPFTSVSYTHLTLPTKRIV